MKDEPSDLTEYRSVMIRLRVLREFLGELQTYQGRLKDRITLMRHSMGELLSDEEAARLDVSRELERVDGLIAWFRSHIGTARGNSDSAPILIPITHGTLRLVKALLIRKHDALKARRMALATGGPIPPSALAAADRQLEDLAERFSDGLFSSASPATLLDEDPPATMTGHKAPPQAGASAVGHPIELYILDDAIARRCLDILSMFAESGATDRFDTVLQEATRILESRLRAVSGAGPEHVGAELASFALGGATPRVQLSDVTQEQAAAHLLFRGVFGFMRNPAHHRLLGHLAVERALQQLVMIDYLVGLVDDATHNSGADRG